MTHTVILFRGGKKIKAFWAHYSSHCGCALIWNKVEGQGGGKAKKGIAPKLNCKHCFYAGWKQNFNWRELLGSCLWGCTEERRTVLQKPFVPHFAQSRLFPPKMLFVMGDRGNNYTGESLKPEALRHRRSARHDTWEWGKKKKEHNLHKPAKLSFDYSMAVCAFLLQRYCVQFVFRICFLSKCGVTTFCQTLLLVSAIWCVYYSDGGQTGACSDS